MKNRTLCRVFSVLAALLCFSFGAVSFASMPAFNRFTEGVAAVQGTWYDLDGSEAFVVAGTSFNGRTIRSVTSYGGSAEACNADFCLEGENGEKPSYINVTWTSDRRFLLVNGMYCRNSKEPVYFESARGVFLGMKKDDMLALLGEPTKNVGNWRFVYPDMTINTSGGMVVAIFLPCGAHVSTGADSARTTRRRISHPPTVFPKDGTDRIAGKSGTAANIYKKRKER